MKFHDHPWMCAPEILRKKDLSKNPFKQLEMWFQEALNQHVPDLNAMSLATASKTGKPSCRTVLLKQFDEQGLVFFTNYESRKAQELTENPYAMVTFFWQPLTRQVCVEGIVKKTTLEESFSYFSERPRGSQIGAWVSKQDKSLSSREVLEERVNFFNVEYEGKKVPLPTFWGGFRLIPSRFEFWQGGKDRLHDRFNYIKENGLWKIERLYP